jgi:uncharacterized membrane protein HdeD (DUF308 family)
LAIRAITVGIFELVGAFSWVGIESRWLIGTTGMMSVLLGILLLASPGAGGLALLWTIGAYAIVFGAMRFALGLRLLSAERHDPHRQATFAG